MWEDSPAHAWSEKGELFDLVTDKVRTGLGIDDEGSSRSYDEGSMEHKDVTKTTTIIIMPKSRKLEKRQIHKQKQRANSPAKLESYEDLEARLEHMEPLVKVHFSDEDPNRAMTTAKWETNNRRGFSQEGIGRT